MDIIRCYFLSVSELAVGNLLEREGKTAMLYHGEGPWY